MLIKWFVFDRSVWNFVMYVTNVYRRCATVLEKNQARCPVIWKCVPNVGMLCHQSFSKFDIRCRNLIACCVLKRTFYTNVWVSAGKFSVCGCYATYTAKYNCVYIHAIVPEYQAWCAAIQNANIVFPHKLSCTWPIGLKVSTKTKQLNRKSYNCPRRSGMMRGNSKGENYLPS